MVSVLVWWLAVQLFGLLALPLAFRVFRGLPDRGWAFARPLGLLLGGFIFWMAGSLGLLRNDLGGVLAALAVLAALSLYVGRHALGLSRPAEGDADAGPTLWQFVRANRGYVIVVELFFFVALALWALYRAYAPEIATAGGEKFMEYAFINAILRSPTLPPADPWLSGFAISYYHFGYLIVSMLIRLSGVASNIAFNLALPLLFALTLTGAFGLVYNLVRWSQTRRGGEEDGRPGTAMAYGALGSVLLAIMGNLEAFFEVLYRWGVGGAGFWQWLDLRDLVGPPMAEKFFTNRFMWWWRASRVLQDVDLKGARIEIIDEFPFFSFMLGDIHPHVLALPFILLIFALALNILLDRDGTTYRRLKSVTPTLLLYVTCLGAIGFLNTWDLPICIVTLLVAFMARGFIEQKGFTLDWLMDTVVTALTLVAGGVVLYLPFYISFQSQAGGLAPALWAKTRLHHYLIMFGPFVFIVLFLWAGLGRQIRRGLGAFAGWRKEALVFGGIGLALAVLSIVTGRWTALLLAILLALGGFFLWRLLRTTETDGQPDLAAFFAVLLIFAGLLLTFGIEFVYLQDSFNNRMNTIFKFYFQAWVLLALGCGYGAYYLQRRLRPAGRAVFGAGLALLLAGGLLYPLLAAPNRAGNFAQAPTLNGIAYVEQYWADDYLATEWLKATVQGPAVILEANGGSYTQYGRVSALTGIPTLVGWGGHELQWRGSYDLPGQREPEIERAYKSTNIEDVQSILERYQVNYVYVGSLEREKFQLSAPMIEKFGQFMDLVYDQGGVRIYRRRGV